MIDNQTILSTEAEDNGPSLYHRSSDNALMVRIKPHQYVNVDAAALYKHLLKRKDEK